ncbi:MAG: glycosyltransferase, partial [Fidelibacterota bacterium]
KLLEYGSQRIAGIYSKHTPYAQSVIDGETGLLVEREDPDLWYDKIKFLIEEPAERRRIQQQAYDYVRRERTLGQNVRRWYDLYSRVLAESPETRVRDEQPLVSIVMLTFNALEYTKRCVDSLSQHTAYPHEIIFVDNGSTDGTKDYLRDLVATNANYQLIDNETNVGFSAGNNQGAKEARGKYLLLLNNDVLVADGWLESLVSGLERDERIGMIGPISNHISGLQQLADIPYQNDEEYYGFAKTIRTANQGKVTPRRRIAGFAILVRRALYDQLGGLDETFSSGNYEDDDLCLRAREKGYAIMVDESTLLHHFGSRTFADNVIDYEASLRMNEKIFRTKWPEVDLDWLLEEDEPLVQVLERKSQEAIQLINQGDLEDGRKLCREILLEDPTKVEAVYGLGLVAHLQGDLREARNHYERVLSLDREWTPVQQSLALLDMAAGDLDAAQLRLAQILEKDPGDLNARRLLGQTFLETEKFEEGIGILMGILNDDPNDWQTHFLLASLYAEVDRTEDVKRHLEAVLAANPDHAEAREMLDKITQDT